MKDIFSKQYLQTVKVAIWYGNESPDTVHYMPNVADFCQNNSDKSIKQKQQEFGIDGKKVLPKKSKMLRHKRNK